MAGIRHVPREEDVKGFVFSVVRRFCENVLEILVWIKTVFLCRFDYTENGRACLSSRRRIGEQPVLSADDERLDASLGAVVVDLQFAILNVSAQVRLFLDQIIDRLAEL